MIIYCTFMTLIEIDEREEEDTCDICGSQWCGCDACMIRSDFNENIVYLCHMCYLNNERYALDGSFIQYFTDEGSDTSEDSETDYCSDS